MIDTVATIHSEALPADGAPPRCQLVVIEGPDMGRAAPLHGGEVIVGTADDCNLVLSDERASRRHLSVGPHPDGGWFVVRDLGSLNGTLFEGSLLTEARVGVGATFKLGRSYVRIQPRPQPLEVMPSQSRRFGDLVAESLVMREIFAVLELAAGSDVTVLLEGETGTGKELAARAVHEASARRGGPFVALDCGALPETLLESELFGHVRGAFSGAVTRRDGAFQRAAGGTIFLDELGGVPLKVQARLLRVLEERRVRPVGADDDRPVDVRVLAASPTGLEARVAEGVFRPDLYYRLSVVRVTLPPLRDRREDIAPVVAALLRRRGLEPGPISGPNLDRLYSHGWPGNVRELRNIVDRAIAMSPSARSFAELRLQLGPPLGDEGGASMGALPLRADLPFSEAKALLLEAFEARYLRDLFARSEGNLTRAAATSGLDRKHLRTLLRRHGLVAGPRAPGDLDPDGE